LRILFICSFGIGPTTFSLSLTVPQLKAIVKTETRKVPSPEVVKLVIFVKARIKRRAGRGQTSRFVGFAFAVDAGSVFVIQVSI
jgi:hypothetical protein